MNPGERDEVFRRAESSRVNGDYEAALPLYESILTADPEDHEAILGVAYCQLNIGLFDESIETFRHARFVNPSHVKGRLELAKAHAMLGMFPEAKREFLAALALDPENEVAQEQLAYFPDDIEPAPSEDEACPAGATAAGPAEPAPPASGESAAAGVPIASAADDEGGEGDEDLSEYF